MRRPNWPIVFIAGTGGTMTEQLDFEMTRRYLRQLCGRDDTSMTFQVFDDSKQKDSKLAEWISLDSSDASLKQLAEHQANGVGVFIMVNRGDGNGRKSKNVLEVRALFIDLDGSPWEPAATMLKPHIMVESSPGRYHLYWLVSDCSLDQFKPLQQAIAGQYGGDRSCVDLSRVLRVPGFLHQKHEKVLTKLIEANDFPKYSTEQVIAGLQLILPDGPGDNRKSGPSRSTPETYEYTDPSSGEVIDLVAWAATNPNFDMVAAVDPMYRRGKVQDGKQHISCPFESEHTDHDHDKATFIANASPPQHNAWDVHCMHSHCAGRDRLAFVLEMLKRGWISIDQLLTTSIEMRRPKKIYFPIDDILADPGWTALNRDERGIALLNMTMCWSEIDGMIADDDWIIARRLSISTEEWQAYRTTFSRVSWLTGNKGRLSNHLLKREFDNAQKAYMASITKARNGGKSTQAKKRDQAPA